MSNALNPQTFRQSLSDHLADKAAEAHSQYGPTVGWKELLSILEDRSVVRYPCEIQFDTSPLQDGEFAHPVPKGEHPSAGFTMYVHPHFLNRLEDLVPLVLYQLVLVNYGDFASDQDAEIFGAGVMGLPQEQYYELVCRLADELSSAGQAGCGCA